MQIEVVTPTIRSGSSGIDVYMQNACLYDLFIFLYCQDLIKFTGPPTTGCPDFNLQYGKEKSSRISAFGASFREKK